MSRSAKVASHRSAWLAGLFFLCGCAREPSPYIPDEDAPDPNWIGPQGYGEPPAIDVEETIIDVRDDSKTPEQHVAQTQRPSWQIVYFGKFKDNGADYTILDLFEHDQADVARCRFPIAYFSGHYEDWRPDAKRFGRTIGKLGKWKGERYVDWRDPRNQAVMKSRLDRAKAMGFRGVDIDNVDGPGGRDYFPWLFAEAKKRGLKVGLKNFVEILPAWGTRVDFFVSEGTQLGELTCYRRFQKPVVRMGYGRGAKTPDFIFEVRGNRDGNKF